MFNLEDFFFVEVKKESDRLREPQLRFFYLVKQYFQIKSKLIYLSDKVNTVHKEELIFEFTLPLELKAEIKND